MLDITQFSKAKTEADFDKAAADLGSSKTDIFVFNALAALCFAYGRWARTVGKMNTVPDNVKPLDIFDAKFRSPETGREPLKGQSPMTFRSAFKAFTIAGFHAAYDAKPVADWVVENIKGAFTGRGAAVRKILEAYPDTLPTSEEMDATVNVAGKAKKLVEKTRTLYKAAQDLNEDETWGPMLADAKVRPAYLRWLKATRDLNTAAASPSATSSALDAELAEYEAAA